MIKKFSEATELVESSLNRYRLQELVFWFLMCCIS